MCLDWYIIFLLLCLSAHTSISYSLAESYGMRHQSAEYTAETMTDQNLNKVADRQLTSGNPGPLKSLNVMRKKNVKTVDEYGNIVLNGRVTAPANFTVHTRRLNEEYANTPPNHFYNVIFCKDDLNRHCNQNGLVLCWQKDPYVKYGVRNTSDPRVKHVVDTCGDDMVGVGVSTMGEKLSTAAFRVDTSWGNTYTFEMPTKLCFTFWIMHWAFDNRTFSYNHAGGAGEGIVGITYWGSSKAFGPGFAQDYWDTLYVQTKDNGVEVKESICDTDSETNKMLCKVVDKKVTVKFHEMLHKTEMIKKLPKQLHSVSKFRAVGGGPCCHLKAKVLGRRISKCYFQWKPLRKSCEKDCRPRLRPCEHWYTMGLSERLPYGDRQGRTDKYNLKKRNTLRQKFGAYLAWEILPDVMREIIDGMLDEAHRRNLTIPVLTEAEVRRMMSPMIHMLLDDRKLARMWKDNCTRQSGKIPDELQKILDKRGEEGLNASRTYAQQPEEVKKELVRSVKAKQDWLLFQTEQKLYDHYRYSKKNCKTGKPEWIADEYDGPGIRMREDPNGKSGSFDVLNTGIEYEEHNPVGPGPPQRFLDEEGSEDDTEQLEKPDDLTATQLSLLTDSIVRELEDLILESFDTLEKGSMPGLEDTLKVLTNDRDYLHKGLDEKVRCEASPYVKEARQLVYICQGTETDTGITEIFSNYPDHLAKVEAREKELGYPPDPEDGNCE